MDVFRHILRAASGRRTPMAPAPARHENPVQVPVSICVRPLALEQRFMFDGAAVATAAAAIPEPAADHAVAADASTAIEAPAAVENSQESGQGEARKEAVFIDTSVSNWQALAAGVSGNATLVTLDGSGDLLAQIAAWAETHSGYDAIHILGHGEDGSLRLGELSLTAANVSDHADALASIGKALTADGDLLFYGCNSGAGTAGQALAEALAAATGADVALSDDLTGAAARGGNWLLETRSGSIETVLPLAENTVESYQGLLALWSGTVTFDGGDGGAILDAGDTDYDGNGVASYSIGGYTLTATGSSANGTVIADSDTLNGLGDNEFAFNSPNQPMVLAFSNGEYFDLTGLTLINLSGTTTTWVITGKANGSTVMSYTTASLDDWSAGSNYSTTVSLSGFTTINSIEITATSIPSQYSIGLDDIQFVDVGKTIGPAVTDARISITSTGSGTGGAYKIGDTVTASWNNSATGDNNSGITGVTFDFSQFGGGSAVTATNSSGIWSASYTLTAGSIDATNRNVSVSATGSSGTTTTADTTNLTVDNQAPTVTDANISISGGSGTGGAYKIGDTVTATWDNRPAGDNNTDTLSSVTVDFSQFGGGSAVTATNSSGIWTATYTLTAGSIDATNRNISFTVTDNAGNATTRADTTNATVDNQAPTVTDTNISISGGSGTGGAYKIGDTVTATWDNRPAGDNNTDTLASVTFDFSAFGGGAAVAATNSAGVWTATYTLVSGALNGVTNRNVSVTVTDNAGNATTHADTTNATVDNQVPAVTGVSSATANGGYRAGDSISIQVNFGENVTVTGTPTLTLNSGGTAVYDNGSGTSTLNFVYVVQPGDTAADLDFLSTSALSGGTITDTAGNPANQTLPAPGAAGSLGANKNIVIDTTMPSVTGVTSSNADGTYKIGDILAIQVNFSESVTVTGTPTLTLNNGHTISYSSGSGSSTLTFLYTVGAGDTAADLDLASVSALALGGGNITDIAHNDANLTLPAPGAAGSLGANKDLAVDGIAPAVSGSVSVPADATYPAGQNLDFTITFDDTVTITGTASTLTLDIGGVTHQASYLSKTANSVTYRYTVQVGDDDSDGIAVSGIALNGDTIRDAAGNNASLSLSGHLPALGGVLVDAALPTISGNLSVADGHYGPGAVLTFTVPLNKNVTVDTSGGSPTLDLTIGASTRSASYDASASTATTLVFHYTVQAGDNDSDGIAINSLSLNSAVIQDNHGNAFDNSLSGHLPSLAQVLVDTTAPTVSSVSVPANGTYIAGQPLDFTVNFDEAMTVDSSGGTPRIALTLNSGGTVYASYVSGSGTSALVFRYPVPAGDYYDNDGITVGALGLNGGSLRDAAGNPATLTLNSVGSTAGVLVDGRSPAVSSVSVPADAIYAAGQSLSFTVTFDELVTVNTSGGTPGLTITLDTGGTVLASYVSGSGTSSLVFSYTVNYGEQDLDGISLGTLSLNGGTIRNASGNDALVALNNAGATSGVLVDAVPPAIASVSVPASGAYREGQVLSFTVTTSEAVFVNTSGGTPRLALDIGGVTRYASYVSGSGSSALLFQYSVQAGDNDSDGISIAASLSANGATLRDAGDNNLDYTLNSTGSTSGILIDTTAPAAPAITSSALGNSATPLLGGTAENGATVSITLGGATYTTIASGGSWSLDLATATPVSGSLALNLNGANSLSVTAIDAAGNISPPATQTLVLDTTHPAVGGITRLDTSPSNAASVSYSVVFSEDVSGVDASDFDLVFGGTASGSITSVTAVNGHSYIVTIGNLAGEGSMRLDLRASGTGIADQAGNPAGAYTGESYGVDHVPPGVVSVGLPANGGYAPGQHLDFTLNFAEAVVVDTLGGTPRIAVNLDGGVAYAEYVSGSGSAALVFRLTIANGQVDDNGITLGSSIELNGGTLRDLAGNGAATALNGVSDTSGLRIGVQEPVNLAPGLNPNEAPPPAPPPVPAEASPPTYLPPPAAPVGFLSTTAATTFGWMGAVDVGNAVVAGNSLISPALGERSASLGDAARPNDTLTRPAAPGGFQAVIIPRAAGAPDTLQVNRGMNDTAAPTATLTEILVPVDAFAHTNPDTAIRLSMTQADGRPLPSWASFDATSGKLTLRPPAGFQGELTLRVAARDDQGREAVILFRVEVGAAGAQGRTAPEGRSGLSEQLRLAARPASLADRLAALAGSGDAQPHLHA